MRGRNLCLHESTTLLHVWTVEEFVFAEQTAAWEYGPLWPGEHR